MKILSRNVNGIRSVVQKWFADTIRLLDPDIVCLQETKAFVHQCPQEIYDLGYTITRHTGTRAGYAGTAILSKKAPDSYATSFAQSVFHEDGRVTEVTYGNTCILNIYFPNGWTRADGTEMLTYKLSFYDTLMSYLQTHKQWQRVIVIGDLNICHTAIDIARPKENVHSIGFLPIERAKIGEFLTSGFVDAFRHLYPDALNQYTWWSYRSWAKANNVGRRIDYACVSREYANDILSFAHYPEITGSDHCPIMIEVK